MTDTTAALTPAPTQHNWLWVDLETTGLDPRALSARILEVALVLANDGMTGDLTPMHDFSTVVGATAEDVAHIDPYVRTMHTKNGLLSECAASTVTIGEVDDVLLEIAREVTGAERPRGLVLAGFSVHFDLDWIRVHLPKFAGCLSHRVFDVSVLKAAGRAWLPGYDPAKGEAHRALADVRESLRAAAEWRQAVGL